MDKSLDDMVKASRSKRTPRGGRRPNRSVRAKVLGTNKATAVKAAARKATAVPAPMAGLPAQVAEKIIVSGLPLDVNEQQIREFFTSTVGPIKSIQLHFNPQGKWNGSATVVFTRKGDGAKAYDQYNNRLIDDKRPMKIELIIDPSKVPPPPLSSRVAPARGAASGAPMDGVQRTGRPRRGRRPRNQRPQKTVEDLDAEMEDYTTKQNVPAAATAEAA